MTKRERTKIIEWANTLTDEEVEKNYYDIVLNVCLNSQVEKMYEYDYSIRDIRDRQKYEEFESKKADILEGLCYKRGIKLWENKNE